MERRHSRKNQLWSVADRVQNFFSPKVRSRGDEYFRNGQFEEHYVAADLVEILVLGTRVYSVHVAADRSTLYASCTCPFIDSYDAPCKHIWAVIRFIDERRTLDVPKGRLRLVLDDVDTGSDLDALGPTGAAAGPVGQGAPTAWRSLLAVAGSSNAETAAEDRPPPVGLRYEVLVEESRRSGQLCVDVFMDHDGRRIPWDVSYGDRAGLGGDDLSIVSILAANQPPHFACPPGRAMIVPPVHRAALQCICSTGRATSGGRPLLWSNEPYRLALEVEQEGDRYAIRGSLNRAGSERVPIDVPTLVTAGGVVCTDDHVAALDDFGAFQVVAALRMSSPLIVPAANASELVERLHEMPEGLVSTLPKSLELERVRAAPVPCLTLRTNTRRRSLDRLIGDVAFDYAGIQTAPSDPRDRVLDLDNRRVTTRDRRAEDRYVESLSDAGFNTVNPYHHHRELGAVEIDVRRFSTAIRALLDAGWRIEADGKPQRSGGTPLIEVKSGVDWFELHGGVDFGGSRATLPELLEAVRRGSSAVVLDDGSEGLLPEAWVRRVSPIAMLGECNDDHVRFEASQTALLDALLAAQPEASCDAAFARARKRLRGFDRVKPRPAPRGFRGALRAYQREGLGWLHFLRSMGLGGCLADDMGLGKTVQVLALLESRRASRSTTAPSLVIVPRSVVSHWMAEAQQFAPKLRVLDHTGARRFDDADGKRSAAHFADHDLIVTTYGTLRRDAPLLAEFEFDYVVLDEAQAIKNASTASAKASRLLRARHRLALSGTPIENHVGELFSLFAFLQPGLFGTDPAALPSVRDDEARQALARAVRPLILRRSKEQVATDLPPKSEHDVLCELGARQRKAYDELRDHYRASLLERVDRTGLGRSKMHVLEALLRLRQVACHPGLIDPERVDEPSAKLDVLLERIELAIQDGHKALVFSQFTTFLRIVRTALDRRGVRYEYLDGRTRKRQERIDAFQDDPDCPLFLISLKAGGTGLNLTAADYVFVLDPWWNPAVEAQAIDRAHRIGQTKSVFAYRLIASNTVEERIRELQESKRELVEAILGETRRPLADLTREDLERLLA